MMRRRVEFAAVLIALALGVVALQQYLGRKHEDAVAVLHRCFQEDTPVARWTEAHYKECLQALKELQQQRALSPHKPPPFMGCEVLPRPPNDPNCIALDDLGPGWSHCLSGAEADQRACSDLKRKYEQEHPRPR